jgi:hypothetical protein
MRRLAPAPDTFLRKVLTAEPPRSRVGKPAGRRLETMSRVVLPGPVASATVHHPASNLDHRQLTANRSDSCRSEATSADEYEGPYLQRWTATEGAGRVGES